MLPVLMCEAVTPKRRPSRLQTVQPVRFGVARCEVAYFQLTPLFTYVLSNFMELILHGRSDRLAIPLTDVGSDSCLF